MSYKIKPILLPKINIAKSPYWNARTESLYYVDLYCATIFRYDFYLNTTYQTKILNESVASFVIPIEHVTRFFLVGLKNKVSLVEWDGISETCEVIKSIFEVELDEKYEDNRFNIGKIDPEGRFYGGTMRSELNLENIFDNKRSGNLYKYQGCQKEPIIIMDNVSFPNGIEWNITKDKFYYIDSIDCDIKEYDYDPETGDISNPKILIDFHAQELEERKRISDNSNIITNFVPNDIVIDSNGFLYVCGLGNSTIKKIDPSTGTIVMQIAIPTKTITGMTFGGPDMNILFVTTASSEYMKVDPDHILSGCILQIINLDVTGIRAKNMALKLCICPNHI